jgi:hypothetical protein
MIRSLSKFTLAFTLRQRVIGATGILLLSILQMPELALQPASSLAAPVAVTTTTIITVDTSADLDSDSSTTTCNYTNAVYVAATDGCTLRRAWIEASARPQIDRPITIQFQLPPQPGGTIPQIAGVWILALDRTLPPLSTDDAQNKNGQVYIDGSTQPGGRSDGPAIIIDTNDFSLHIESENNVIRNLAFRGGGGIFLKEGGNTLEHIWMGLTDDGQSIALYDPPKRQFIAGGGIYITSDNNTIQQSVISGAFPRAIRIDDGDNNLVANNYIGTRSNGSVPPVAEAVQCIRSPNYDSENWYGGWGIALSGSNNQIIENRLAGLHVIQSNNDTPPIALEIVGAGHLAQGNVIGIDSGDAKVGVCGQGIKVSGQDIKILSNMIVRSRTGLESNNGEALKAAILASESAHTFGEITVRMNLVEDGPGYIYQFGTGVPQALALFEPARIIHISGMTISGTQEDGSPCPGCLIDLYLDDGDATQEALEHLGSAIADAGGAFSLETAAPLPAGASVRTSSTTQAADIISGFGPGATTGISRLFTPVSGISIDGPTTGQVGMAYPFTITVTPLNAETPITYTVEATEATSQTLTSISHVVIATHTWNLDGVKTIGVTIENYLSAVSATHEITINSKPPAGPRTFLPVISR